MNEDAVKELDRITKLNIDQLTPQDIAFLKARQSYLNREQRQAYASVIEEKPVEVQPVQEVAQG